MLEEIIISNAALIEKLDLTLKNGLSVISGETGAGKSILFDAIGFALGNRGDKTFIRTGKDYIKVELIFSGVIGSDIIADKYGFEDNDGQIIVSRKMTVDGRNDCRINGSIVNTKILSMLGDDLIDVYGQHDSKALLDKENYISILDSFIGASIFEKISKLQNFTYEYNEVVSKLNNIYLGSQNLQSRVELLTYQIEELKMANIIIGQEQTLKNEKSIMSNYQKIFEQLSTVVSLLNDSSGNGALNQLYSCKKMLNGLTKYGETFEKINENFSSGIICLNDSFEEIQGIIESSSFDEDRLLEIDTRLDQILSLYRKYSCISEEDLLIKLDDLIKELDDLNNSEQTIKELEKIKTEIFIKIEKICNDIHLERLDNKTKFINLVENELNDLNMTGSSFDIVLTQNSLGDGKIHLPHGNDVVEFYFSANKGEDKKLLSKVISGGEMSRFMLAIKNIQSKGLNKTLLFDEIDSGISGKTGQVLSEKLANISKDNQTILISHLPSLVAMADNNYVISKYSDETSTYSNVALVDINSKINEVARLSGGENEQSILHAKALIQKCNDYKEKIN